jgi:putative addiction module component (TIGR02574 family)
MTKTELKETALQLSPGERLELVEVLWESLEPASIPVTEAQKRVLDERIAADDAEPDSGSSWSGVRERIEKAL